MKTVENLKDLLSKSPLDYTPTTDAVHYLTEDTISRLNTLQVAAHSAFPFPDNIQVERFAKPTYINIPPKFEPSTSRKDVMLHAENVLQERYGNKWGLIRTACNDRFNGEDSRFYEELMIEAIEYMRELQKQKIASLERELSDRNNQIWEEIARQCEQKNKSKVPKKQKLDPNSLEALLKGKAPIDKQEHLHKPKSVKEVSFSPPKSNPNAKRLIKKILGSERIPPSAGSLGLAMDTLQRPISEITTRKQDPLKAKKPNKSTPTSAKKAIPITTRTPKQSATPQTHEESRQKKNQERIQQVKLNVTSKRILKNLNASLNANSKDTSEGNTGPRLRIISYGDKDVI